MMLGRSTGHDGPWYGINMIERLYSNEVKVSSMFSVRCHRFFHRDVWNILLNTVLPA